MKYRVPSWTLALLACLLWSTAFVGVKYALTFAQPIFIAGVRFLLAGLILIPFAGTKGYLTEVKDHFKIIAIVGLLQTVCVYFLYFLALDRIKASTGAALVGLGPMIGAILGHFFVSTEVFTKKKVFSFILGVTGVTVVSLGGGKNGSLPDPTETIGIILFILSSIAGAFSNVFVLKYKTGIKPSVLTSAQLIMGGLTLFIMSLFLYQDITFILPIKFYIALGWLIFVSAAGFSMWYHLLAKRKESLISMNIWKFIMPVAGGILGWIIMPNDSPNVKAIAGMIIVAISIIIYYSKPKVLK
ncbi:MAG: DMT family transporter [Spirochaetaceae bacterium]